MNRMTVRPKVAVAAGMLMIGCALLFPKPAKAEQTSQPIFPFTLAAANTQPIVGQLKPDGLAFLRGSLSDGIFTGEQTYTILSDGNTFTLRFLEKGDNVNGELYAGRNASDSLRLGAGFGNDFWGVGALGTYSYGKWALVYNESGSRGTLTGAVNRLLIDQVNTSLKLTVPISANASPSAVLGGDFDLGNNYQLGLSGTLGTTDEFSAYLMGKYAWGKVVFEGLNIGRDDTTYRFTALLNTK